MDSMMTLPLAGAIFLTSNLVFNLSMWRKSTQGGFDGLESSAVSRKILVSGLGANLLGGILFGVIMALDVYFFSSDPSWFLMPLFMAPVGYWSSVGLFALVWIFLVRREFTNKVQ
jgi:hypothetical protein